MMKKTILMLGIISILAGCAEPVQQELWVKTSFKMSKVPGFEDCTYAEITPTTNAVSVKVIRCPNSATSISYMNGKVNNSSIVIDSERTQSVDAHIFSLEETIRKQQEILNTYQVLSKQSEKLKEK